MDLDAETASISSTIIGIASQRMVRRICPNCRTAYQPTDEELDAFSKELPNQSVTFYQGTGCNLCANTGYRGRIGIFEFLVMSEAIRKMLRDHAGADEMKAQAITEGMITMRHDGMLKVKDGITSIREVMRSVFSVN
jgi:type II secretory ATPase GspE/PulE/Tfp pilus assembly ATPase PilB-like protein